MNEQVLATIRKYKMLAENDSVMVGVSGGADSMTLLCVLLELKDALGLRSVYACHFNHGLRGGESDSDEEFVREWCRRNGVTLFVGRGEMAGRAKPAGESLESWARALRYEFYFSCIQGPDDKIALAHNRGDCVETALFNLARGTDLRGLAGIPPVRGRIIRPLIETTRADIETYCAARGIDWRVDATNSDPAFSRNRLRLRVLPELELAHPGAEANIARFCGRAARLGEWLARRADALLTAAQDGEGWRLAAFAAADPLEAEAAVARLVHAQKPDADETACALALRVARGELRETQLTAALWLRAEKGRLFFRGPQKAFCTPAPRPLTEGDNYFCPGVWVRLSHLCAEKPDFGEKSPAEDLKNALDCGKISGNLILRARGPGDRFTFAKRGVTKSLRKLMNELRLSEEERARCPVVADDLGVVWLPETGACARCAADESTKEYYRIARETTQGENNDA